MALRKRQGPLVLVLAAIMVLSLTFVSERAIASPVGGWMHMFSFWQMLLHQPDVATMPNAYPPPNPSQNLIQNPNFESELAPWRVSFFDESSFNATQTIEGTGHSLIVSVTEALSRSGFGSNGVFQRVPISPGAQYHLSGQINVLSSCGSSFPSGSPASGSSAALGVTWRDANETYLGLPDVQTTQYHDLGNYQPSIAMTAPANAALAGVYLSYGTTGPNPSFPSICTAKFEFSNIQLLPVATAACTQSATSLCLNGNRFQVTAHWTTPDGKSGDGQVVRLTADSGYFWFFSPTSAEVTVKILNGCAIGGNYWVFAAGMTNVEVDLNVTDTKTGMTKTYRNPQGGTFATILDTSAFPSCP